VVDQTGVEPVTS